MNLASKFAISYEKRPIVFPDTGKPAMHYQVHLGWWPWIILSYLVYRFIRRELRSA